MSRASTETDNAVLSPPTTSTYLVEHRLIVYGHTPELVEVLEEVRATSAQDALKAVIAKYRLTTDTEILAIRRAS